MNFACPAADEETSANRYGKSKGLWIQVRRLESVLWIAGLAGGMICAGLGFEMLTAHQEAAHVAARLRTANLEEMRASADADPLNRQTQEPGVAANATTLGTPGMNPAVIGRVEIPAIGMTTPLFSGDDSMSLLRGAGHIPGTAFPGGLGTVGIAGHRDTHFRLLSRVAPGMEVRLIDRTGIYHYKITSSEIVTPEQINVLDINAAPGLVLITCYPFRYIGAAPKRFVVHANLLSVAPD